MPTTAHGNVSLYYESFGADDDPVLLLVNGLGSQCINFKVEFCTLLSTEGFRVVRFDNRDVGLSSHLKGGPKYTVDDMADDGDVPRPEEPLQTSAPGGVSHAGSPRAGLSPASRAAYASALLSNSRQARAAFIPSVSIRRVNSSRFGSGAIRLRLNSS